jgi:hypothetical protein
VAEKVHAYTRRYGTQQQPSTRPKDLVDILLISGSEPMDAAALREALERTFEQRARQPLPEALPAPPDSWRRPFALLASEVGIDPNLAAAFRHCSGLSRPGARQADVGAMGSGRHAVAAQPYDVMGGKLELAPAST